MNKVALLSLVFILCGCNETRARCQVNENNTMTIKVNYYIGNWFMGGMRGDVINARIGKGIKIDNGMYSGYLTSEDILDGKLEGRYIGWIRLYNGVMGKDMEIQMLVEHDSFGLNKYPGNGNVIWDENVMKMPP